MTKEIVTFKGFNKELKCRDFQFEIGKTFHHEERLRLVVLVFMPVNALSMFSVIIRQQTAATPKQSLLV